MSILKVTVNGDERLTGKDFFHRNNLVLVIEQQLDQIKIIFGGSESAINTGIFMMIRRNEARNETRRFTFNFSDSNWDPNDQNSLTSPSHCQAID